MILKEAESTAPSGVHREEGSWTSGKRLYIRKAGIAIGNVGECHGFSEARGVLYMVLIEVILPDQVSATSFFELFEMGGCSI